MKDKKKIIKEISSWIILLVFTVLFSALLSSQVFAMTTIEESSMQNTLYAKQKVVLNRLAYKKKTPEHGDIIIFYKNREIGSFGQEFIKSLKSLFNKPKDEEKDRLVKRVIGITGDTIDIKDGVVYLNGNPLDEPYAKGITYDYGAILPVTLEDNQLFVLGDNREVSEDSRDFGPINLSHVEGKVTLRTFPLDKFGKID
jgi:signal peptidase I